MSKNFKLGKFFDLENHINNSDDSGFSLLLVLLFVGIISGSFAGVFYYQSETYINRQAYASGWHLVEVSKAARLFVRNTHVNPITLDSGVQCCSKADIEGASGSIEIELVDLINAGHLSPNLDITNALGQDLRIFAASYPPVADPDTQDILITSYVLTNAATAGTRSAVIINPRTSAALMEGARASGLSASSPLIVGGANLGDNCFGNPSVIIWDTGCLSQTDVTLITSSAGGGLTIGDGQVIVPTWRAVDHDLRAMMRFEQPENIVSNQMFTNLHLGDVADFSIVPDTGTQNNRVDLLNVGVSELDQLTLENQNTSGGVFGTSEAETVLAHNGIASDELVLSVNGDVISNGVLNLGVTFGPDLGRSLDVAGGINVANSVVVEDDINIGTGLAITGNSVGGNLALSIGQDLSVGDISQMSEISLSSLQGNTVGDAISLIRITPGNGITTGEVIVDNVVDLADFNLLDSDLNILNNLSMNGGTLEVLGGEPFAGTFDARFGAVSQTAGNTDISVSSDIDFNNGAFFGDTSVNQISVGVCTGNCPDETTNNGGDIIIP